MNSERWIQVTAALGASSVEAMVEAASQLHREADLEDVPRLLELLQSDNFFAREAAAWPLAELAGPNVLSELFSAYQRGFDEGHDNDGFTAALLEIPSLHPLQAKSALLSIVGVANEPMLGHAKWLLEFCPAKGAAP